MFKLNETIVNITTTEDNFDEYRKRICWTCKEFPKIEDSSYDFILLKRKFKEGVQLLQM